MTWSHRALAPGLCLAVLLACNEEPDASSDLEGRVYVSQSVTEDGERRDLVTGTLLMLRFQEGSRLTASAGCNSMDGPYEVEAGTLALGGAGVSEIGCEVLLHAQDDWYFGFLGSSPSIEIEGDSLVLEGESIRVEYLDQEVASPDLELVGPMWTVETIIEDNGALAAEWTKPATLSLRDDGTAELFTGCNAGSVAYTLEGSALTFGALMVDEEACRDETSMRLEAAVLATLGGSQPVTWEVTVDRLSLRAGGVGLDLRAR